MAARVSGPWPTPSSRRAASSKRRRRASASRARALPPRASTARGGGANQQQAQAERGALPAERGDAGCFGRPALHDQARRREPPLCVGWSGRAQPDRPARLEVEAGQAFAEVVQVGDGSGADHARQRRDLLPNRVLQLRIGIIVDLAVTALREG